MNDNQFNGMISLFVMTWGFIVLFSSNILINDIVACIFIILACVTFFYYSLKDEKVKQKEQEQ